MNHKFTTPISNILFDTFLPSLTHAQLKILLLVLRQTAGWNKSRDRMTYSQLMEKTGLSRRVIAKAIQSLIDKRLLVITDYQETILSRPVDRQGKTSIFFSSPLSTCADSSTNLCRKRPEHVQKLAYNKRNNTKETKQRDFNNLGMQKIGDLERFNRFNWMKT